jgi:hypothetical protein
MRQAHGSIIILGITISSSELWRLIASLQHLVKASFSSSKTKFERYAYPLEDTRNSENLAYISQDTLGT